MALRLPDGTNASGNRRTGSRSRTKATRIIQTHQSTILIRTGMLTLQADRISATVRTTAFREHSEELMTNAREIATLEFRDVESDEDGVIVIRVGGGSVGLAISLRTDGDIEVFLSPAQAVAVAEKLREASLAAESLP